MSVQVEKRVSGEAKSSPVEWLTLPRVWALAAVLLAVAINQSGMGSIDLAYHLRLGEGILRSHTLPRIAPLAYTTAHSSWTDQQWGAQVLFAEVFRKLGWGGLAVLAALIAAGIFAFVYLACRATGHDRRRAAWLTLGAAVVSTPDLPMRPQLLAGLLFAATVWAVSGRRTHPRRLWIVPLLVAVWANVHGSFFLAPLLLVLAWIEDRVDRAPVASRTFMMAPLSALASLLNPFGPKVWSYVASISTNPHITKGVTEWQPPTIRSLGGALLFGSVAAVVVILARRGGRTRWVHLLMLGVFLVLALDAGRNALWWGLAAAPVMARVLSETPSRRREVQEIPLINWIFAGVLVVAVAVTFPWSLVGADRLHPGSRMQDTFPGITTELQRTLHPGDRIFNAQEAGSWLEFAFPRNPVFVDSIIEAFPDRVWRQDSDISNGREGWQSLLQRWNVRAVVLTTTQPYPLLSYIRRDPGWRLDYSGEDGYVFLRRGQNPPG